MKVRIQPLLVRKWNTGSLVWDWCYGAKVLNHCISAFNRCI